MAAFLLRRFGLMLLTLWLLSLIVFFAGQVLPGDPGRAILGPLAAQSAVHSLDVQLGGCNALVAVKGAGVPGDASGPRRCSRGWIAMAVAAGSLAE